MSGEVDIKAYEGPSITVTFEAGRCLHAAECVHGLPEVFDTARRPWIQPDRRPRGRSGTTPPLGRAALSTRGRRDGVPQPAHAYNP